MTSTKGARSHCDKTEDVHAKTNLTHEQVYFLERQHLVAGVAHHLAIRGAIVDAF